MKRADKVCPQNKYTFQWKRLNFLFKKKRNKNIPRVILYLPQLPLDKQCGACLYISFPSFRSAQFTNKLKTNTENLNKNSITESHSIYMPSHRDHDNKLENISLEEHWKNIMQSCLLKNNFIQVTLHSIIPPPTIVLLYLLLLLFLLL